MKLFIFMFVTVVFSMNVASAESIVEANSGDAFISCSGYHHGSYLDFFTNQDGSKIMVQVSNDGEPANGTEETSWPVYEIANLNLQKEAIVTVPKDFNATLIEVVNAMNDTTGSDYYGYVRVEAKGANNSSLVLNLNNWFGDSFMVLDGNVEPITCNVINY